MRGARGFRRPVVLALVVLGVAAVAAVTLFVAGALLVAALEFSQF